MAREFSHFANIFNRSRVLMMFSFLVAAVSLSACTSPSKEGMQSSLKAQLPVDAIITFE